MACLKLAGFQALLAWHSEHCPMEWLAGLSLVWQDAQSVALATAWLKVAPLQAPVVWQAEHCPV